MAAYWVLQSAFQSLQPFDQMDLFVYVDSFRHKVSKALPLRFMVFNDKHPEISQKLVRKGLKKDHET